jgi:hypothetical protein
MILLRGPRVNPKAVPRAVPTMLFALLEAEANGIRGRDGLWLPSGEGGG